MSVWSADMPDVAKPEVADLAEVIPEANALKELPANKVLYFLFSWPTYYQYQNARMWFCFH